jgi:putative nucleotidyltransferase with HDIG domain
LILPVVLCCAVALYAGRPEPAASWALQALGAGSLGYLAVSGVAATWYARRRTVGTPLRAPLPVRAERAAVVHALAAVLDEVDAYTRQHSIRVAVYSRSVARTLRLPEAEVEEIEWGALLHDLGKVNREHVAILVKRAPLSADEVRRIRRHPDQGADLVARVPGLERVAEYVRSHHERLDGRGYPRGLAGASLSIGARIIVVCDAFDAMTSDRPYRKAVPIESALAELWRCTGTQFDGGAVAALERAVHNGRIAVPVSPAAAACA